ncbi:hypothetical protein EVAR_21047_1 [Eumeta japonica]|uniref:Uncharacterized protein n=1 Tax=Eumeta variegata TaxID=151549 RepID=A0A4C1V1Q5_EUMVA|nr:hypothetical protein EVAR_21047_1 [Eumeta japonica]
METFESITISLVTKRDRWAGRPTSSGYRREHPFPSPRDVNISTSFLEARNDSYPAAAIKRAPPSPPRFTTSAVNFQLVFCEMIYLCSSGVYKKSYAELGHVMENHGRLVTGRYGPESMCDRKSRPLP